MLTILNKINRNLIRTNLLSHPAYVIASQRVYFSDEIKSDESSTSTLGGFARAFEKFSKPQNVTTQTDNDRETFHSLLRNSKFIDMGDPSNKVVIGKIYHIVDDDLYIDFGWKFHCVCTRPQKNPNDYVRGAKVRLRVKELELSTRFLGSSKDLTILEADCQIIGLISSPAKAQQQRQE